MNALMNGTPSLPTHSPSLAVYRRIATVFVALTVLVVVVVGYVVLSKATVIVMSQPLEVSSDFIVDVSRAPQPGEVKGEVLVDNAQLTQKFPSTSVVKVDTPAEGRVKIASTLFRPQTLVATTRLLTPDGVLFRIKETVVVPANGSVEVDAFAAEAGKAGAVGNATFIIPGLNEETRRFFTVTTVTPFVSGANDVRMVTKEDVDGAEAVLKEKLAAELTASLRQQAHEKDPTLTGELIAVEVINKLTDVPIGTEAADFGITVGVKVTAVFYDEQHFLEQVRVRLKERLESDRVLASVDEASLTRAVEKTDMVAGRANLRVTAKGSATLSPEAPDLSTSKLTGVSADAAKQYLESVNGVSSASIKVSPPWTGRMPNVASHIHLEIR